MKRAEYVAVITRIYSTLIKEDRLPTPEEMRELELAFSRNGFTQGYLDDRKGAHMFGVRDEKTPEPKELFARARQSYAGENPRVDVRFYALLRKGEPAQVGVKDQDGHIVTAAGQIPEPAQNLPLTAEQVEKQLSRTGGTPYRCTEVKVRVDPDLNLPLAALNALRREVLEGLSQKRLELPLRKTGDFHAGVRYDNPTEPPALTVSVRKAAQISPALLRQAPAILYVPAEELAKHPEAVRGISPQTKLGVILPRVIWDREWSTVWKYLEQAKALGATEALIGNLGFAKKARELGFNLHADFGIPVFNAQSLKELKHLGFATATASFELKLAQIRDLSKALPVEGIVYGRLPLMLTENCIIKNRKGVCNCENENVLTDRKGEKFPVLKADGGCRSEIFNSRTLFLADKPEWTRSGLTYARLMFTTESPKECAQAMERYAGQSKWTPDSFTRGLYYRGVE